MRITGDGIWGEPKDREEAKRVLLRAVELEVNLIDTADSYGPEVSERLIGETLHPVQGRAGDRDEGRLRAHGTEPVEAEHQAEASARGARGEPEAAQGCSASTSTSCTTWAIGTVKLADAIGELAIMQSEGKIRHIGVSNFSRARSSREARSLVKVVSVQNRYNLGDRASEAVLTGVREARAFPFLPWAPLGKSNTDATTALEIVARRHGATTGQIAIAALLAHSTVMLPIPGTSRVVASRGEHRGRGDRAHGAGSARAGARQVASARLVRSLLFCR